MLGIKATEETQLALSGWALVWVCFTLATLSFCAHADTSAFAIIDDPELDRIIAEVRADFLATRDFDRLDVTLLLPNADGSWRRGSYNPEAIAYPASCVKLAYLAAAMYWCRTNNKPYDYLDDCVRPMIVVSDNVKTGEVVDALTGACNDPKLTSPADPDFLAWYEKRLYTEDYLRTRGLLENQTIMHKTYPSNSGRSPTGAEKTALEYRGRNMMQPKCSASLMLEIIKGAIEPEATTYMRELLIHDRWSRCSSIGLGLPPGSHYENKIGMAYDTLEDIAYVLLPNGQEFILAAYSNGWERDQPMPCDGAGLGIFCEMLVARLGLDQGNPPKITVDDSSVSFGLVGDWCFHTDTKDQFGFSSLAKPGGDGSARAIWHLNVPEAGFYEVCIWHPRGSNHATDAPFTIHHANGSAIVYVNQQKCGGCWFKLGDYFFDAGQGQVVLSNDIADGTKVVVADAVKASRWPSLPITSSTWWLY